MPRLSRRGGQIPWIVVEFLQRLLWNRFESATARRLAPMGMIARLARTLAPNAMRPAGRDWSLHHPCRLLVGWHAPVWGELIDQVRQMLTEAGQQIVHAQAGLLTQCIERVAAERICQILRRDLLIRAGADPGLRGAPMSVVL